MTKHNISYEIKDKKTGDLLDHGSDEFLSMYNLQALKVNIEDKFLERYKRKHHRLDITINGETATLRTHKYV